MGTFKDVEQMEVWRKSREFTKEVYLIIRQNRFSRDYCLRDQICRASISVMSNIAEGFERGGSGEFIQFLSMAKGSIGEAKTHLYIAVDQEYIDKETFSRLNNMALEIGRMIGGLINYLRDSNLKGVKYKTLKTTRDPKPETRDGLS